MTGLRSPLPVTVFTGSLAPLPESGRLTGMFKQAATGTLELGPEGFVTDQQADRRVHGGPEKAVHLYPSLHYARLAEQFPTAAELLVPGGLGENLSCRELTEADVCVGDIFGLGEARLQICQPRSPCWKIDCRFGVEGMAAYIGETGMTGWYFRVLRPGCIGTGDPLRFLERDRESVSLAEAMRVWRDHRPALADLETIAASPGISPGWQSKLRERAEWLRRQIGAPPPPLFHVKPPD